MIPAGIISADGHVCEPANCYVDYIDPKYRDDAPRIVTQDDGTDAFVVPGMKRPVPLGFIDGAGFGPRERLGPGQDDEVLRRARGGLLRAPSGCRTWTRTASPPSSSTRRSAWASACTATPQYKDACMWAYNRWLADMCAEAPDRVFGMAQTAVLSVDEAIADFQRAKDMGFVGMMMPGDPIHEDYDHPDYDALWECATDLRSADLLPHPHVARGQPARRDPRATR